MDAFNRRSGCPIIDEKDVLIFPNPTSGSTTLRCTLPNACKYAVLVIDAAGRTISTVQWISSAGQQDIPVAAETMEAGAYIIELRDAKGVRVGRTRLMKLGRMIEKQLRTKPAAKGHVREHRDFISTVQLQKWSILKSPSPGCTAHHVLYLYR
ncbi:MAG: T9SS type A sorting domain-containing protein [Flavobacteriales bacterium]|nr:T9SS type A sorting domain-containing protein [Flavobacteriales bacterium]